MFGWLFGKKNEEHERNMAALDERIAQTDARIAAKLKYSAELDEQIAATRAEVEECKEIVSRLEEEVARKQAIVDANEEKRNQKIRNAHWN